MSMKIHKTLVQENKTKSFNQPHNSLYKMSALVSIQTAERSVVGETLFLVIAQSSSIQTIIYNRLSVFHSLLCFDVFSALFCVCVCVA